MCNIFFFLQFDDFNLENDYDVVSIYDGRSTLDPLVGNYSGNNLPTIPISSSNNLLVQFHSDQDNQSTGFNVTWFAGKSYGFCFISLSNDLTNIILSGFYLKVILKA